MQILLHFFKERLRKLEKGHSQVLVKETVTESTVCLTVEDGPR